MCLGDGRLAVAFEELGKGGFHHEGILLRPGGCADDLHIKVDLGKRRCGFLGFALLQGLCDGHKAAKRDVELSVTQCIPSLI